MITFMVVLVVDGWAHVREEVLALHPDEAEGLRVVEVPVHPPPALPLLKGTAGQG